MIYMHELNTPNLSFDQQAKLAALLSMVSGGYAKIQLSLTYTKQTETKRRIAGQHYQALPGVSFESQIGEVTVHRHVDNPENRRKQRVGRVYLRVKSITRMPINGQMGEVGYTNIRPEGIMAYAVTAYALTQPQQQAVTQ